MDNELMNNEFFKKLPEDVKEKLKNCKSEEEAMDILKDNMIEIPPEELKKVSGGAYSPRNDPNKVRPITDRD